MKTTYTNESFLSSTDWLFEGVEQTTECTSVLVIDFRAVSLSNVNF